jgi:acetoin utilization deacetylase AcuC-like enzyme
VLLRAKRDLAALPQGANDEEVRKAFADLVEPLIEVSKCPDFVVNRGHYFGTDDFKEEPGLSDRDKWALIEFLKTM